MNGDITMPMSDEYHKIGALEAALEWFLLKEVSSSSNPKETLADFESHMKEREEILRKFGEEKFLSGDYNTHSNVYDGVLALEEVRKSLVNSVLIS
jgi:hypothetical protein